MSDVQSSLSLEEFVALCENCWAEHNIKGGHRRRVEVITGQKGNPSGCCSTLVNIICRHRSKLLKIVQHWSTLLADIGQNCSTFVNIGRHWPTLVKIVPHWPCWSTLASIWSFCVTLTLQRAFNTSLSVSSRYDKSDDRKRQKFAKKK